MRKSLFALSFSLMMTCSDGLSQSSAPPSERATSVTSLDWGQIRNLYCVDDLFCSGQFDPTDIPLLKEQKFKRIISLRQESEINWNEGLAVQRAGIEFVQIPIAGPTALTDEVFNRIREELRKEDKKTLLHCGVGGRVAAAWLPYRVLDQRVDLKPALEEAQALGLSHPGMRDAAVAYIVRVKSQTENRKSEHEAVPSLESLQGKSVKPGINDNFLDENLDVDEFVKRFEIESREIFVSREKILAASEVTKGMSVADIGAGTGLFSRLFSVAVGDEGWVYAVEIAPRFLEHINQESTRFHIENISGILCTDKSSRLPRSSVDVVFVCDTYHHFEFPSATLKSIFNGLRPGGMLIIVDFERIPGVSREWILDHVRAGKETVRQEIEAAGFEFVEEQKISGLEENYFLRFVKPKR